MTGSDVTQFRLQRKELEKEEKRKKGWREKNSNLFLSLLIVFLEAFWHNHVTKERKRV